MNRHRLLKNLTLNILLHPYSDDDCAKRETENDRAINNKVASNYMFILLDFLAPDGNLTLVVKI